MTKQKLTALQLSNRRHQAFGLKVKGYTVREIAEELNISPSVVHHDIEVVASDIADRDIKQANNNRMLANERYETLLRAYFDKAIEGDTESAKLVIDIVTKQAKINGLIPKEPLVNFNQFNPPPIENFTFHIDRANLGGDIDESEWEPATTIQ